MLADAEGIEAEIVREDRLIDHIAKHAGVGLGLSIGVDGHVAEGIETNGKGGGHPIEYKQVGTTVLEKGSLWERAKNIFSKSCSVRLSASFRPSEQPQATIRRDLMSHGRSSREQARVRLSQIELEVAEILRVFPELRGRPRVRRRAPMPRRRLQPAASGFRRLLEQ
jgi:hypothetical protein